MTAPVPSNLDLAHEWVTTHAKPSVEGQGGDDALFAAACALVNGFDLDEGQAMMALGHYNQAKCSPCWSEARLKHKIAQARGVAHEHKPGGLARWMLREKGLMPNVWQGPARGDGVALAPQVELTKAIFDYTKLAGWERADWRVDERWFMGRSPITLRGVGPVEFVNHVFPSGSKVLVFTKFQSQGQFIIWSGHEPATYRLAERPDVKAVASVLPKGGADGVWYLCNPVDGKWHPNPRAALLPNGQVPKSRRSMESVTAWSHMVLECDHKEKACPCKHCQGRDNPRIHALWLNFLAQLPLPIVAIYTSAGKSVHALVKIDALSKEHWDRFRKQMIDTMTVFGADPAAMTAVRLTRLPGCLRGGREQKLIYLNPSPDPGGVPIGAGGNICVEQ